MNKDIFKLLTLMSIWLVQFETIFYGVISGIMCVIYYYTSLQNEKY